MEAGTYFALRYDLPLPVLPFASPSSRLLLKNIPVEGYQPSHPDHISVGSFALPDNPRGS